MENKNKIFEYLMIVFGNLLVAIAVSFFILPNNILTGGVAGVVVAIQPLVPIDSVILIDILTVSLFLLGFLFLGKQFAARTLLSTIVYPVGISIFSIVYDLFPKGTFIMEPYLASIYAGLICGLGLGICFRVNASTGGMDIPALILHKYTHISSGNSVAIIDVLTILLGLVIHGLEPALIGILSVFTSSVAINRAVLLGTENALNCMIISDKWIDIRNYLVNEMERGVTILDGIGGYTEQYHPVVMCVIKQKQLSLLKSKIMEIDSSAFIIVNNVNEVHGEGFTYGLE
ncbi:MAG: YitT family protein [Erysipelotrichaceae bacterium]|uniref:YitT family protein n=1 Tax=Floccifex sp. TaxID=2815810 RepID=UPI002A7554E1|nr:YitT family protein [Floccifex sp.]MDD7282199.1 YitT family protein [Erysipelotrichaceae bacterium]MDY2958428.1 YitT family protein [Floccifex sp.]